MELWVVAAIMVAAFAVGLLAQRAREQLLAALRRVGGALARFARAAGGWVRAVAGSVLDLFARETTTLDIEDTDLRFMVVKRGKVRRWGSVPLQPGTVKGGLVQTPDVLVQALRELIASKRLKKGGVLLSLSGFQSVHRTIELPRLSGKLLGQAIMTEAKRAMPVSLDQLYLSWQVLSADKSVVRVLVLGTPKNLVDAEIKALRGAGLKPEAMSLKPLVLARMVNHPDALIIDVEPQSCEIIVVSGGVPAIMRSVQVQPDGGPMDWTQHILHEFERTLRFYESNYSNASLSQHTPLFLTGKLAHERDVAEALAAAAGFDRQALVSELACPPDMPLSQHAVNVGLALKAAKRGSAGRAFLVRDLNMLPQEYRPRSLSSKQLATISGVVVGLALVFPLYQIAESATASANQSTNAFAVLEQRYTVRQIKVKQQRQIEKAIADAQARQQALQKTLDDFQQIGDKRKLAYSALRLPVLNVPDGLLPQGVTLTSVSEETSTLSLHGTAPSYDAALQYADALRGAAGFSNVQVHSLARAPENAGAGVVFDIGLNWN